MLKETFTADPITNVKLSMYTFDEIRMYKKPTLKTQDSLT